jgi:hypothetical protein
VVPWSLNALSVVPPTYPAPGFEGAGVRSLFYERPPWRGRTTRVFAWCGVPDAPAGREAPGMVLVHGGGGKPGPAAGTHLPRLRHGRPRKLSIAAADGHRAEDQPGQDRDT